jgi:hypothetical protein
MAETIRTSPRAAPVVQLMMGLKQQPRPVKLDHLNRATLEDFEREHLGIAAKE